MYDRSHRWQISQSSTRNICDCMCAIDGDVFSGDNQLEALTTLKSKHDLIGEIIGLLQSPAKNVISGLNAGGKLASLIKALEERNA